MLAQLASLRAYAYNVLGGFSHDKAIDTLLNHARLHVKHENVKNFNDARFALRTFVWGTKLPSAPLSEDSQVMLHEFNALLRWVHDRPSPFDADRKLVSDMFSGLILAVGAGNWSEFNSLRADIKELVSNEEMGV